MRRIALLLVAVATMAGVIASMIPAFGQANENSAPVYLTKIPAGYRDWRLISVAHEEGDLNSFAAVLGNDIAVKGTATGSSPFPTAQLSPLCTTATCPRMRTTRYLAANNLSFPAPPQTFSS